MRKALVILAAVICSGCLRSTTVISVKPDGSGTVMQETGLSPQALAMIQGMAAGSGAGAKVPPEIFGEDQAKKAADAMGVQFLSGEPIKTPQLEGYRARFSFADIRQVRMKMNQSPTPGMSAKSEPTSSPFKFDFEKRGSSSVLTVNVPDFGSTGMNKMTGMGSQSTPEQQQQAITMMKAMLQNLFVDVSLDVDGRIVKTNAPHVAGSRVTLLQLDFNELLADEAMLKKLQAATDLKGLANVRGLKILTEPKVSVEFSK